VQFEYLHTNTNTILLTDCVLFLLTAKEVPKICANYTFASQTGTTRRMRVFDGALCNENVLYIARKNNLTVFVELMERVGLDEIFQCSGPFTAMIPTNEAFAALDANLLANLTDPANNQTLKDVLLYHLIPGYLPTMDMVPGPIATLQGANVQFGSDPLKFNNSTVIMPDILACNGVMSSIDTVLLPPNIPAAGKSGTSSLLDSLFSPCC